MATLLVRDEEEVLRACIDYHLAQGVDLILAMDNGSQDATPNILAAYEREGAVRVIPGADSGQYRQAAWVTKMARIAYAEHAADWVVHLDADEFWWPTPGGTLPDVLAAVPDKYGVVNVKRVDFDPVPAAPGPFWERMTIRRRVLRTPLGRRGLPRVAHRGRADVEVSAGNHIATGPGLELAPPVELIEALHFPTRSYEQLERKVAAHAENIRATPGLKEDIGEENLSLDDRRRAGTLRAYFGSRVIDEASRAQGLADGSLIEDHRLAEFFAAGLSRRRPQPVVTEELGDAFEDVSEWLRLQLAKSEAEIVALRHQVAALASRLDESTSRVDALESAYRATDQALQEERRAHYATAEALRLLRMSRAVRLARRLRRLRSGFAR